MAMTTKFTPEIFATTLEWSIGIGLLENGGCKAALASLDSVPGGAVGGYGASIVDIVALNGYKYVHLAVISMASLLVPSLLFWPLFGCVLLSYLISVTLI